MVMAAIASTMGTAARGTTHGSCSFPELFYYGFVALDIHRLLLL